MKRALMIFLIIGLFFSPALAESDFCRGFEAGYVTGYKQASGSTFDPFPPFCPFQPFKSFSDPESDYEHGYTVGYRQGYSEGLQK